MLRGWPVVSLLICLGIGFLGVLGSLLPVLSDAEENLGLHLLYRLRGVEKPRTDVVVVAIDRKSARGLNLPAAPHKWPRKLHAQLLDRLAAQQASVVAFDLIFHDSKQSSDDQAFAAAIERAGNVILTQPIDRETMPLLDQNGMPVTNMTIEKMVSAIPVLADAAMAQAPFPLPKVPIKLNQYWRFGPGYGDMPTLPVVVMHVYAADAFHEFIAILKSVAPQEAAPLQAVKYGRDSVYDVLESIHPLYLLFERDPTLTGRMMDALDRHGSKSLSPDTAQRVRAFIRLYGSGSSSYLNFYGPPKTIETISYHDVWALDASEGAENGAQSLSLKGKAVFVGQTESDWFKANDGFYTAFTQETGMDISGVEVAATAFANLMEDKVVHPFDTLTYYAILVGWGGIVVLIALHFSTAISAAGLILLSGLYLGLAHFQFKSGGVWYPLVVPILLQMPSAFIAGLVWKYRRANVERRNIREAFGYYLPDEVVNRLAANAKALRGGGQVLYSICLFTDAESYTPLSERLDPEQLTDLMNEYYEAIFRPIKENNGVVLQVVGDSVLSLWTAPQPDKRLNRAARKAALGINQAVNAFNATADHPLPTRIGLHAGEILLGNIGAMDHFEYRPVGDIVNTASRLEGLNKYLGTRMLISGEALGQVNGGAARSVGKFVFKGKSQPVEVYEILRQHGEVARDRAEAHGAFASGLQAFGEQRWDAADELFNKALEIDENDGPSKFYIKLCAELRQVPPHSDWNGAVHLNRK